MRVIVAAVPLCILALAFLFAADDPKQERLSRLRNLGKAFYENPTTQNEAVEQFRQALDLAPDSVREQLNYALALLRAGKTTEAVELLQRVQKRDPALPHTWFNLGIVWKKAGETERALAQFERLVQLVPDEPIARYNLGAVLRSSGETARAAAEFEAATKLDHTLAAPHFQLFNLYRTSGRAEDARRELSIFQEIKKQQEGAAIPEDVEWSMYAEIYDPVEPAPALEQLTPQFERGKSLGEGTGAAPLSGGVLVVWSASAVRLQPGATVLTGVPIVHVAPGDFNNDGFSDLCVLTESGPRLFTNTAGKMTEAKLKLPPGEWRQALWIDYDHDYDLDLMLIGKKSVLLRNAGASGFDDQTAAFPFAQGEAIAGAMLRVVPDTKGFDVVLSYADRQGVLYRDLLQGRYEAEDLPVLAAGARNLTVADLDNDSAFDLVYLGTGGVYSVRNEVKRFAPAAQLSSSSAPFVFSDPDWSGRLRLLEGIAVADIDGDGREDILRTDGKTVASYLNRTTSSGRSFVGVRLEGVRNLKLGNGAEVEVKAGKLYQKKQYSEAPLLFATPAGTPVETVRITWPNGLIQNEVRQPAGRVHSYKEAQRLSGSCPIIWSWNGSHFEYITDVLGVAPLGAAAGEGEYFPVDHDEYVQIPGTSLVERDGIYEIRITEELSEVAYLDTIRLLAVDRPARASVYTSEKFKSPPFPQFRLYSVQERVSPVAARDHRGQDVLSRVLHKDRIYPDTFRRTMSGEAELHHLELDFRSTPEKAMLVMNGWVDWADGSTFLRLAQEKRGVIPPYLQVRDTQGKWVTVIEDMGMPAGKPKTIVVDLSDKFLSDSRDIRIVTNLCVYWDEIFLSSDTEDPGLPIHRAALHSAELRFRGFSPNQVHPRRTQPEQFTYEGPSPVSLWNPTPGMYTRYGDVRELALAVDDELIVMGSGDELRLQFDARSLPPVPRGYARDFLLYVDGWAKDRDANTAHGQSTEPLPFHAMSRYPYPPSEKASGPRPGNLTRPALRLTRPLAVK